MTKQGVQSIYKKFADVVELMEQAKEAEAATEDPRRVVQDARARQMGRESKETLLHPMMCEEAGRAISIGAKRDPEILWQAFLGYAKAEDAYFRRVIGKPRFPNVARMEILPDTFEARPDDTPDLRSEDEKHRDAVNTWARWQGLLGQLPGFQRRAIINASWQRDELHKGGRLTVAGETFVAAARSLADVVEQG